MPRRARLVVPEIPLHIIQRGNNRNNCFFARSDYLAYLSMLQESAALSGCRVHAYVLMTNHVHLLVTPPTETSAPTLMKSLGERYVQYVNRKYGRAGTLWQGRYRSCLVQDERYFLVCKRYIDMNPVRASMVSNPGLYQWSSHRFYAYGDHNPIITPHQVSVALGHSCSSRHIAYRELCNVPLASEEMDQLRDATNNNFAFCDSDFADRMSTVLGRPVLRCKSGPAPYSRQAPSA